MDGFPRDELIQINDDNMKSGGYTSMCIKDFVMNIKLNVLDII